MLAKLLNVIRKAGSCAIVTSTEIKNHLRATIPNSSYEIIENNDLRSATFYAYGKAQKENITVVLIAEEKYLSNCYTALTEAWFQHVNLYIVALTDDVSKAKHEFLNPCVVKDYTIYSADDLNLFQKEGQNRSKSLLGPVLITIQDAFEAHTANSDIIESLMKICAKKEVEILFYCDETVVSEKVKSYEKLKLFPDQYKYGAVSKYIGYILGNVDKYVLIIPHDVFELDLNILNNRYLDNRFKVVIINFDGNMRSHQKWIQNNNIQYSEIKNLDEKAILSMIQSEYPEIFQVLVKEEFHVLQSD